MCQLSVSQINSWLAHSSPPKSQATIDGVPCAHNLMEALASLPTEVYTPPFLHQEQYDDIEEFLDDVSDWLSDEYGWCHFGFETETDDGGIIKCDTLPE